MSDELPPLISDAEFNELLQDRKRKDNPEHGRWDTTHVPQTQPQTDGRPESSIEQSFAHIAEKLTLLWPSEGCGLYLESLILNEQGRDIRKGFPKDVIEDFLMLHSINEMRVRKIGLGPDVSSKSGTLDLHNRGRK